MIPLVSKLGLSCKTVLNFWFSMRPTPETYFQAPKPPIFFGRGTKSTVSPKSTFSLFEVFARLERDIDSNIDEQRNLLKAVR